MGLVQSVWGDRLPNIAVIQQVTLNAQPSARAQQRDEDKVQKRYQQFRRDVVKSINHAADRGMHQVRINIPQRLRNHKCLREFAEELTSTGWKYSIEPCQDSGPPALFIISWLSTSPRAK
jgi:hypothetical protein